MINQLFVSSIILIGFYLFGGLLIGRTMATSSSVVPIPFTVGNETRNATFENLDLGVFGIYPLITFNSPSEPLGNAGGISPYLVVIDDVINPQITLMKTLVGSASIYLDTTHGGSDSLRIDKPLITSGHSIKFYDVSDSYYNECSQDGEMFRCDLYDGGTGYFSFNKDIYTIGSVNATQFVGDGGQLYNVNCTAGGDGSYNVTYQNHVEDDEIHMPSGAILMFVNTSCPTGYTQLSVYDAMLITASEGDDGGDLIDGVATSVDNTTIDQASVSALSGNNGTHTHTVDPAITDTSSNNSNHVHTYTEVPNHIHNQSFPSAFTGAVPYLATDTSTTKSSVSQFQTSNPVGGVATGTTSSNSTNHIHTVDIASTTSSAPNIDHNHTVTIDQPAFSHNHTVTIDESQLTRLTVILCIKD